jgi:hypothetical protein
VVTRPYAYLDEELGATPFKPWDGHNFTGKFLMSVFEVLATGVSHNVAALGAIDVPPLLSSRRV